MRIKENIGTQREAIGEVLSSSIVQIVAESWKQPSGEDSPHKPAFGSFLSISSTDSDLNILAVVFDVVTGSPDNVHKPWALGLTREQLRSEQPHIFSLLRTEIHAAVVGFIDQGRAYQHLPAHPPQVHDFVYQASAHEISSLTECLDFLRLLMPVSAVPVDELIAAAIRNAWEARGKEYSFLVSAGQALTPIFANDYDRLISLVRKIQPF